MIFLDDVAPLALSSSDLQLALGQSVTQCEITGMRISTSKSEVMIPSLKRVVCPLQFRNELLAQVEEFNYF